MSDDERDQIYEVEVKYHDSGMSVTFDLGQWGSRIEDDFSSFEAIKSFYRTDVEELAQKFSEEGEEIGPDETRDGPGIVISNAPKEWKEDMGRAAPFLRLAEEQMVRMALYSITEEEVEAQRQLLDDGQFKPLIIRQSAFFEAYLELQSQLEFQELKEGTLSNKEMDVIEDMGHTDRIRLAHLFGVIDEGEHGYLQSMATLRNRIAHSPWGEFDSDEEQNIKVTAEKVLEILESEIEQANEALEENEIPYPDDDFEMGFSALDPETQFLQLSILDVVRSQGGEMALSDIERVLPENRERVNQRCLRMNEVGYVDLDDSGTVTILQKGRELLADEYS